jgi:hypothetical protein
MTGDIHSGTLSANDQSESKTIWASILAKLDKLENIIEASDRESKERYEMSNRESGERLEVCRIN